MAEGKLCFCYDCLLVILRRILHGLQMSQMHPQHLTSSSSSILTLLNITLFTSLELTLSYLNQLGCVKILMICYALANTMRR